MLFYNFLRINCQIVVRKLTGHKYTISWFAMTFCRWRGANAAPNSEKKYNRQFKHRAAVNKLYEIAMLIKHTARFL